MTKYFDNPMPYRSSTAAEHIPSFPSLCERFRRQHLEQRLVWCPWLLVRISVLMRVSSNWTTSLLWMTGRDLEFFIVYIPFCQLGWGTLVKRWEMIWPCGEKEICSIIYINHFKTEGRMSVNWPNKTCNYVLRNLETQEDMINLFSTRI